MGTVAALKIRRVRGYVRITYGAADGAGFHRLAVIVGVVRRCGIDLHLHQMLVKELVGFGQRERQQAPAHELIDRREQQPAIAGELLRRVSASAGVDHGGQIIRREVLLHELTRRFDHELRAQGCRVQVVQHQHVQPAGTGWRVGFDVGRNRPVRGQKPVLRDCRNIDVREHVNPLRLAVFEQLEIVPGQAADDVSLAIGDHRVHVDIAGFHLEGDWRRDAR